MGTPLTPLELRITSLIAQRAGTRSHAVRVEAEAPVAEQWPGFVNLVGLYAADRDPRLARRVRAEVLPIWERPPVGNTA